MPQLETIGANAAKTHLADLLRQVHSGQSFTITYRGEPVADLLPAGTGARRAGQSAALKMQGFMANAPSDTPCDIKAMIGAGRD